MILECGCGKMYRVRDDAAAPPTKCPSCGGPLKQTGRPVSDLPGTRARELETRVEELAKERDVAKERAAALERELESSRSPRPTLSAETTGFADHVAELRASAEKADRLERELFSLRSEMERRLKEKDSELAQSREGQDREAGERRSSESRVAALEETHARALEGKEQTIQALDASIASYRSKVETLQKKLDAVEIQRLSDINSFDSRLREREQADHTALDRATQAHQKALVELRAGLEAEIAEKDRQITEARQHLDREAGERRRLGESVARLEETAQRAASEKDAAVSALNATLATYKSKIETLQGRVDSLERLRRSEADQYARSLSGRQGMRSRVEEANHLAGDLHHGMDGIETSLETLRERVRRLKSTLQEAQAEPEPAAPALSALSSTLTPASEPAAEFKPALSQASWAAPAPAAEPEPEPEVIEEPAREPEPIEETTGASPEPVEGLIEEPASDPIAEQEPEFKTEPAFEGRVAEPSQIIPIVRDPEPPPAAASADEGDDIPLISPPEEEAPPAPPTGASTDTKKRFSWQRK